MISAWTKNLSSLDEQERFKSSVMGSKTVLDRLQEIMNEMKADADSLEMTTKIYDIPNWDYRQADMNGYKRCLKQISKIINLDQEI